MSTDLPNSGLNLTQVQGVFSLYSEGRFTEALDALDPLLREHPGEGILYNLAGLIHAAMLQYEPAIENLQRAIALKPDVPDAHFFLGNTLMQKGDAAAALEHFERAIELRPGYVEAHSKLCEGLERSNRVEALADALARARQHCPATHPALALREAELLKRQGDIEGARSRLESSAWQAADDDTRETAAYLLCDLCDRLDATEEAFGYAEMANRITQGTLAARRMNPNAYFELIDELTQSLTDLDPADMETVTLADGRADPVFLVGFPRSGTTLLNTVLQTHGEIDVLEEVATVYRMETELRKMSGGYGEGIARMDAGQCEALRDAYFSEVDAHIPADRRAAVLVDKLPLNMVHAALIHRVFPRAKFLFAERHPCDAVLSCYMRNFRINEAMVNCTDLGNAAKLYDRVMTLWSRYRERLPLAVHTVRYEALVSDFEATMTKCLAFLGLEWEEGLRNFMATEINRGRLGTPSYNQVTEELYSEASGRWQRYRTQLEPVLPMLLSWTEKMGYQPR